MKAILILPLIMLFAGCVSNISNNPNYPTDYKVGAIYRLKQPVFADKSGLTILGTYSHLTLYLPNHRGGIPPTVQEYINTPQNWYSIAGIVPPGTLIRVTKIKLYNSLTIGKMALIRGQILDLPWAKKDVELAFISKRVPTPYSDSGLLNDLPMVDSDLLELVSNDILDKINQR